MSSGKQAALGAGAAIALAAAIIAPLEGKVTSPYRDPVGILTVCYGHTGADIQQRKYTDAECLQMLEADVRKHAKALECTDGKYNIHQAAAIVSLAYNIGVAGYCKSTSAKRAQAGDYAGACEAMSRHVKAGGKVLQGLVDRRAFERAICESDFAQAEAIAKRKGLKGLAQAVADIKDVAEAEAAEAEAARSEALEAVAAPASAPANAAKTPAQQPDTGKSDEPSAATKAGADGIHDNGINTPQSANPTSASEAGGGAIHIDVLKGGCTCSGC